VAIFSICNGDQPRREAIEDHAGRNVRAPRGDVIGDFSIWIVFLVQFVLALRALYTKPLILRREQSLCSEPHRGAGLRVRQRNRLGP